MQPDNEWRDNFALAIISVLAVCGMTVAAAYLPGGQTLQSPVLTALVSINTIYAGHNVSMKWIAKRPKKKAAPPEEPPK